MFTAINLACSYAEDGPRLNLYAHTKVSDATQLGSADRGATTILWKESGTGAK